MTENKGTKDGLIIRGMRREDAPQLAGIESRSFSMPWSEEDFLYLVTEGNALYLVAEYDGTIAGCAGMRIVCGEGSIDNVVVDEPYRGQGIAQALLGKLIREGEARGAGDMTLEVRISNAPAIHVYEKFGFVSEGVRPNFYEMPCEDALILWRRRC
ncbi:MAG: ribosomal protein S18-alanine N-acetyltransferase [Lachnospiraceae bacterium]|nr:ribosomal protein S18-alanine N-acetyltransferase [Lachnospiraceae bacterium]